MANSWQSRRLWIGAGVAVVLAAVVALILYYIPAPQPDCTFLGWKHVVGVDVEAKVGDLQSLHTKVGLTSAEVVKFDALLKDYAAKYDAACIDMKNGRMNQAEYTCRRHNMDQVLDSMRMFGPAVDAAKSIADPQEQARQIREVLQLLGTASRKGYGAGCVSAIAIDPHSLTFAPQTPERSIHIGNGGNNDITFAIDGLPEAFLALPTTGTVARGAQPVTVSIYRTLLPVDPSRPVTFRVRSNFEEELTVQILLNGSSTALFEQLGAAATARSADHQPTVSDALAVIDPLLPADAANRSAARYFLAMNVLTQAGRHEQALDAYQAATKESPALATDAVALLSHGVVLSRKGDADHAVEAFARAKEAPGRPDDPAKSAASVLAASAELSRDRPAAAAAQLEAPGVEQRVQADTALRTFAKHEFPRSDLRKVKSMTSPSGVAKILPN